MNCRLAFVATISMKFVDCDAPEAYLYVRTRRQNVHSFHINDIRYDAIQSVNMSPEQVLTMCLNVSRKSKMFFCSAFAATDGNCLLLTSKIMKIDHLDILTSKIEFHIILTVFFLGGPEKTQLVSQLSRQTRQTTTYVLFG